MIQISFILMLIQITVSSLFLYPTNACLDLVEDDEEKVRFQKLLRFGGILFVTSPLAIVILPALLVYVVAGCGRYLWREYNTDKFSGQHL